MCVISHLLPFNMQHSSKAESQSHNAAKETGPNANIGKVEGVYEGGRSENQDRNLLDKTQESAYNKMPSTGGSNQTGTGQGALGSSGHGEGSVGQTGSGYNSGGTGSQNTY